MCKEEIEFDNCGFYRCSVKVLGKTKDKKVIEKSFEHYEENFMTFKEGDNIEYTFLEFTVTGKETIQGKSSLKKDPSPEPINKPKVFKEPINIKVCCLDKSVLYLVVLPNNTTEQLKQQASIKSGFNIHEFELMHNETLLVNGKSLGDQGIQEDSVIKMVITK